MSHYIEDDEILRPDGLVALMHPRIGLQGPLTTNENRHAKLYFAGDAPPPGQPPVILDAQGEPANSLTWPEYCKWRRTKCRPYTNRFGVAGVGEPRLESLPAQYDSDQHRALEEIDNATLQFIGEVAELGELFATVGPRALFDETPMGSPLPGKPGKSPRSKLIDECGDILFCGAWVMDAWGLNPLDAGPEMADLELIRVTDKNPLARVAILLGESNGEILDDGAFAQFVQSAVTGFLLGALTHSGLLANSFKKLRYHRTPQNPEDQVGRVVNVLACINHLLIMANSSVEDALKSNMRKLDARYPNGYVPGQGGGNRTGEGA